jgi:hypothetical protein
MGIPTIAGIPGGMDLGANYTVQFTALDPVTGLLVSGVNVSNASILADNKGGGDLSSGLSDTEPLWTPIPNDQLNTTDGG